MGQKRINHSVVNKETNQRDGNSCMNLLLSEVTSVTTICPQDKSQIQPNQMKNKLKKQAEIPKDT